MPLRFVEGLLDARRLPSQLPAMYHWAGCSRSVRLRDNKNPRANQRGWIRSLQAMDATPGLHMVPGQRAGGDLAWMIAREQSSSRWNRCAARVARLLCSPSSVPRMRSGSEAVGQSDDKGLGKINVTRDEGCVEIAMVGGPRFPSPEG